jgi:hypothetical protein
VPSLKEYPRPAEPANEDLFIPQRDHSGPLWSPSVPAKIVSSARPASTVFEAQKVSSSSSNFWEKAVLPWIKFGLAYDDLGSNTVSRRRERCERA